MGMPASKVSPGARARGSGSLRPMSDVCLVTGASGALGTAVCRRLVDGGYRVVLADSPRSQDKSRALAASLGERALSVSGDLASADTWPRLLAEIERAWRAAPTRAAFVAGGWAGGHPLHEESPAVWSQMMQANLETVHLGLRAVVPGMVAARTGSIVVIGSRAVERPWTSQGAAAYAASKSAVVALARTVAEEVLASNVRVNALLPSTIDTPQNRAAMPKADPARWVVPESIANVIAFLFSDEAKDISGASIPVYGRA